KIWRSRKLCALPCPRSAHEHDRSPPPANAARHEQPDKGVENRCGGPTHREQRQFLELIFLFSKLSGRRPVAPSPRAENAHAARCARPNPELARLSDSGLRKSGLRHLVDQALQPRDSKMFVRKRETAQRDKRRAPWLGHVKPLDR